MYTRTSQYPKSRGAVLHSGIYYKILEGRLFPRGDEVDVIATAQTVIGPGEEGVSIGGEVHANHSGLLIDGVIDKAGVLMRKPIVILPPHMRRQQVVERGNRCAPRNRFGRHLEPLGMLVEHRIHHVDKRLVGSEEAMPTGKEIAFEPALAGMFTENLHHSPIRR